MTELESKIWDMTHKWCDGQYHEIPDQNRRYLMDEIKALVLSNVSHRLILALDDYGRKVGRDSYGLPIDPDTKSFDTKHGKEMLQIVESILNGG